MLTSLWRVEGCFSWPLAWIWFLLTSGYRVCLTGLSEDRRDGCWFVESSLGRPDDGLFMSFGWDVLLQISSLVVIHVPVRMVLTASSRHARASSGECAHPRHLSFRPCCCSRCVLCVDIDCETAWQHLSPQLSRLSVVKGNCILPPSSPTEAVEDGHGCLFSQGGN